VPGYPIGRQWFPISRLDPSELDRGAAAAEADVRGLIDAALAELSLPPERLVLVGFSQGTMMSLQVGLRLPTAPAAIIGFSGALPNPNGLTARPPEAWPTVLLVHGDADEVVPVQASQMAATHLQSLGVPVQFGIAPGLGHGISPEGLNHASQVIRDSLLAKA
jgi:phospholipase/carboxylesterase